MILMLMLLKETSVSSFLFSSNEYQLYYCIRFSFYVVIVVQIVIITLCVPSLPFSASFLLSDVYWVYTGLSFLACFLHHCTIAYSYTHTICTALFFSTPRRLSSRQFSFFFARRGSFFSSFISR
jgi:hypothetical protein